MKLGIDINGGDNSPNEIIKAVKEAESLVESELILYAHKSVELGELSSKHEVVYCDEIVLGEDKPVQAVRKKKDSTMMRGLKDLGDKKIDGFISAGSTGAVLSGAIFLTGRISDISRPALAIPFPSEKGMKLLLDAGANAECKPINLFDFAVMGTHYAREVMGIDNPKIGLLNIGDERGKGNTLVNETFTLLEESNLNFVGSIEGRDIPEGKADVFICDGFTGNVILKLSEGLTTMINKELKNIFLKNILTKLSALTIKKGFKSFKKKMDYKEYGGAPLLGIDGCVVKAHGSSDARSFKNAIIFLEKYVGNKTLEKIKKSYEEVD